MDRLKSNENSDSDQPDYFQSSNLLINLEIDQQLEYDYEELKSNVYNC